MVLGQDQDSVGGGFATDDSFQGMLANVNVWNKVLTPDQIETMSKSCLVGEENAGKVFKWLDFLREGVPRLVKPFSCEPFGKGRLQLKTCSKIYQTYCLSAKKYSLFVLIF